MQMFQMTAMESKSNANFLSKLSDWDLFEKQHWVEIG